MILENYSSSNTNNEKGEGSMRSRLLQHALVLLLSLAIGPAWAGLTRENNPNATSPCDVTDGGECENSIGMPAYSFKSLLASLTIEDNPLGYTPPIGPGIDFALTYNAREVNQPTPFNAVNLGPKWTLNWISYIQDDPSEPH